MAKERQDVNLFISRGEKLRALKRIESPTGKLPRVFKYFMRGTGQPGCQPAKVVPLRKK
jgi:hypothetical protein